MYKGVLCFVLLFALIAFSRASENVTSEPDEFRSTVLPVTARKTKVVDLLREIHGALHLILWDKQQAIGNSSETSYHETHDYDHWIGKLLSRSYCSSA